MLKVIENDQMSFNYDLVAAPIAIQAREAAERIKLRLRRSAEDIIEIGRDLVAVQGSIGHGNFLPWIEAEFGMSKTTAYKFMDVAKVYGGKLPPSGNFDLSALYELAAPKTPLEVREEIERMIEAGEVVTKATVANLKAEAEAAKRGKTLAEQDAEAAEEKAATLQAGADELVSVEVSKAVNRIRYDYEAELKALKDQVTALRQPKAAETIDNDTGKVIAFHKELTDDETAEIDAVDDNLAGSDFNLTASDKERAVAFFGAIRAMVSAKASPAAVHAYITQRSSKDLITEYMGMVSAVLSQLQSVKDMHND